MGQLAAARITPAPPFSAVGVDFAGLITIRDGKVWKPTKLKAYISVFVCFVTKATHLEPVSDLSTRAFVAALRIQVTFTVTMGLILWEPIVLYRKFINSLASRVL